MALSFLSLRVSAQTPAAPVVESRKSFTVRIEPVQVRVTGAVLAGRLYLPDRAGPLPSVILIHGARDSRALPGVSDFLAARGIAVLDIEKRGVGGSTGRWDRQSFTGRAEDISAAMQFLRERPELDRQRIGLVGHSQGGWIAQVVAAERDDVAFVVLLAGPAQTVRDQILTDERIHLERRGLPAPEVERKVTRLARFLSSLRSVAPVCRGLRAHYLCHIIDFDPAPYLSRIRVPVLALFAELDPMVPPEPNVSLLEHALDAGADPTRRIQIFAEGNHMFWRSRTGLRDEYGELEREYLPGFLEAIADWIETCGRRSPTPSGGETHPDLIQCGP